uniref:Sensory neuron membrane protein 2 n=1 Tax=Propsilocerus akamusi TaxID=903466 RepID=A0A7D0TD26_9DIPT|nr:sensory neuron membrane protein s3 [Propsilocerus akamusi]
MSKWILIGPLVGVVCVALGLILGYAVFPPMVKQKIIESVELNKDTEQYERWKELPLPLDFKVYLFNVTNPAEIQMGEQPKVEEIGPFVYSQYRKKYNIRFSRDKERASYYQQMRFEFNAEKSYPLTEDDKVVVLNVQLNSILQIIDKDFKQIVTNMTRGIEKQIDKTPVINVVKRMLDRYTPLQSILQLVESETPSFMPLINGEIGRVFGPTTSFFMETTPRQFLFEGVEFCKNPIGFAGTICDLIEKRNSTTITRSSFGNSLSFSMFGHKNRTHDGLYEINTGIRRLDKLLKIEKWRNARTLSMWKSDKHGAPSTCQYINGTDATAAAPFRKENDNFYIFSSDICRSVQLFYDNKIKYEGIEGYRYSTRDNFLSEVGPQYGTECFCVNKIKNALTNDDGCLYPGAIDLTECLDAPVVVTMPHFLDADERYGLLIDGLNPSHDKHKIFIDIEPYTGAPLRGGKKVQFNMFLRKIDSITLTDKFNIPRLFPVVWVDEGLELNEQMTNMIKNDLINVLTILDVVQWTLVGVGAAIAVCTLIWFVFAMKKKTVTKTTSVEPIYEGKTEVPQSS